MDLFFSLGCGRIFEGTYEQMFHSLKKIKKLPKETKIYCGHEYTLQNSNFCIAEDPNNLKIKDNNLNNKKLNNVVLTGGGAMMDNIEKYVETIFASGVRVSSPLEQLNLDNNFNKPNFCDIIGSILYDQDLFKIDFLANQSKISKKRGISGFFTWLDQYI